MVDRRFVKGLYKKILGRRPESEQAIQHWLDSGLDEDAMTVAFLESEEFKRGPPPQRRLPQLYGASKFVGDRLEAWMVVNAIIFFIFCYLAGASLLKSSIVALAVLILTIFHIANRTIMTIGGLAAIAELGVFAELLPPPYLWNWQALPRISVTLNY